jgi:hypothetical protein
MENSTLSAVGDKSSLRKYWVWSQMLRSTSRSGVLIESVSKVKNRDPRTYLSWPVLYVDIYVHTNPDNMDTNTKIYSTFNKILWPRNGNNFHTDVMRSQEWRAHFC